MRLAGLLRGAALVAGLIASGCRSVPNADLGAGVDDRVATAPQPSEPARSSPSTSLLPLSQVADVELPGRAVRFDYQDIDAHRGLLVIAHMNDNAVLFVDLATFAVRKRLTGIPVPRGIAVASDIGRVFVTSSPSQLIVIDSDGLREVARVQTGRGPDGVSWDPQHRIVGVSDQRDGGLSLLADAGSGARRAVKLGRETGNVVFDERRGLFWLAVVGSQPPNQLVAVDPVAGKVERRIDLPGCEGAHGLRLHPDGHSAFVACEDNGRLLRAQLEGAHTLVSAATGKDPDVLAVDPVLGVLYVAAESGDLTGFDLGKPGLVLLGHAKPGAGAHTVAVDALRHLLFFPLAAGPNDKPVLRIMKSTTSS